jgi:uncharacterized protein YcfJ
VSPRGDGTIFRVEAATIAGPHGFAYRAASYTGNSPVPAVVPLVLATAVAGVTITALRDRPEWFRNSACEWRDAMFRTLKPVHALFAAGGLAAAVAMPAAADYTTWATVTQSRPIYTQVSNPQQQCWTERVADTEYYRLDQVPIGVRGTVIDRGGGNDLVAVPRDREVQRCRTVDNGQMQIQGYEVHYLYDGREYVTRLPYDPGPRVRVNVDVQPQTSSSF